MEENFIALFTEIIEREVPVRLNEKLKDLVEWGSLAALSLIAMVDDEYGIIMGGSDLKNMEKISDIYNFIISKTG